MLRDIFLALVSGATLCLPQDNIQLDAEKTLRWLQETGISIIHTVPTLAKTWLANVPAGITLPDLRWVFFAGEPLHDTLVHQWRASFPNGHLVNFYGPTETTMAKCFYKVPDIPPPGVQPVGSPLPQTQALVLNRNGQLCGIAEPGEIVLRTPFRTLGYINTTEENTRKFLPNLFRTEEQDILYYTGDQGRYRPDGQLDILGRIDGQVKVRGVRIELSEIEAALLKHSAVQQGVVSVWEPEAGNKRLAAYIVAKPGQSFQSHELRTFLKDYLPDAMIPANFTLIDAIPLTSNGKINRRALPEPDLATNRELSFVAPRTQAETIIAEIWKDVLRLNQTGIHDNFFELGGDSIMATQVVSRVREKFEVELSLRDLFTAPTVAQLSKFVDTVLWAARGQSALSGISTDESEEFEL